jgi:hypothetical protein
MSEKTPIQRLVEEWVSLDKKRDLRDATHSWLGLKYRARTSKQAEADKESICPKEEAQV